MCGSTRVGRPGDPGQNRAGDHLRADLRLPSAPVAVAASTLSRATFCGSAPCAPGQREEARADVLAVDRHPLLLAGRHHHLAVLADDLAELGVGVAVAVGVFEDDVVAELVGVAGLLDHPVVDGDDRRALVGVDVDAAAGRRGGDHVGGVAVGLALARRRPLQRRPGRDVVGVAGVGGDREVGALGEAGQRADQAARQLAVGAWRRAGPPARTSRRGCRRRSRRRGPFRRRRPSGSWRRRRSRRPGCRGPCGRRRWRRPRTCPSSRG